MPLWKAYREYYLTFLSAFLYLVLFILSIPFLLFPHRLIAQVNYVEKEEARLDENIRNLYQALHKARDLMVIPKLTALPANTIVRYKGTYPNRTGIKIIRYQVLSDPLQPNMIKSSEERSILLEFNGSVLSRVEYTVIIEETGSTPRLVTKIVDETPMDDYINDIEIHAYEGVIKDIIPLSSLENQGIRHNRNNFKKNFYIRLLQDSLNQISIIYQLQIKNQNKIENQRLNRLRDSLNY